MCGVLTIKAFGPVPSESPEWNNTIRCFALSSHYRCPDAKSGGRQALDESDWPTAQPELLTDLVLILDHPLSPSRVGLEAYERDPNTWANIW